MESPRISSGKKASHGRVLHNPITVKAIRQGLRYHKVEKDEATEAMKDRDITWYIMI